MEPREFEFCSFSSPDAQMWGVCNGHAAVLLCDLTIGKVSVRLVCPDETDGLVEQNVGRQLHLLLRTKYVGRVGDGDISEGVFEGAVVLSHRVGKFGHWDGGDETLIGILV
jgi:hypothetical protein